MRRSLLALLLCLPALLGGSLCAHTVGYLIADPNGAERASVLQTTGHSYLAHPFGIVLTLLSVLAIGGVLAVQAELRGTTSSRVSAQPFLLVAPVGYLIQEHLERLLYYGHIPVGTIAHREVLIGLALQLPFAVAAWGTARLVLGTARAVAARIRRARGTGELRVVLDFSVLNPARPFVPRPAALAAGCAGRAPPLAS